MEDVVTKIRKAAGVKVRFMPRRNTLSVPIMTASSPLKKSGRALSSKDRVVVIGSSTGGPRALNVVVPTLPANLPAAVFIVQHMPVGFTRSLAERLDNISQIQVKEAEPGDQMEVGRALIAPGGFHSVINEQGQVTLNQNPPVHGVRPAIDVTLASIAKKFGSAVISVILTGMGSDGTNGSGLVNQAGGCVIAEDESSCVVWGMPRSVCEAGYAQVIVPLDQIADTITQVVTSSA